MVSSYERAGSGTKSSSVGSGMSMISSEMVGGRPVANASTRSWNHYEGNIRGAWMYEIHTVMNKLQNRSRVRTTWADDSYMSDI